MVSDMHVSLSSMFGSPAVSFESESYSVSCYSEVHRQVCCHVRGQTLGRRDKYGFTRAARAYYYRVDRISRTQYACLWRLGTGSRRCILLLFSVRLRGLVGTKSISVTFDFRGREGSLRGSVAEFNEYLNSTELVSVIIIC